MAYYCILALAGPFFATREGVALYGKFGRRSPLTMHACNASLGVRLLMLLQGCKWG